MPSGHCGASRLHAAPFCLVSYDTRLAHRCLSALAGRWPSGKREGGDRSRARHLKVNLRSVGLNPTPLDVEAGAGCCYSAGLCDRRVCLGGHPKTVMKHSRALCALRCHVGAEGRVSCRVLGVEVAQGGAQSPAGTDPGCVAQLRTALHMRSPGPCQHLAEAPRLPRTGYVGRELGKSHGHTHCDFWNHVRVCVSVVFNLVVANLGENAEFSNHMQLWGSNTGQMNR